MNDQGAHGGGQPLPPRPPPFPPPHLSAQGRRWPRIVGAVAAVGGLALVIGAAVAVAVGGGNDESSPRLVERRETTTSTTAGTTSSDTTAPPETTAPEREEYQVGDRVETRASDVFQVFSYEQPVAPQDDLFGPEAGHEFVVIDVEACAGPTDDPTGIRMVNEFDFQLHMPDNTRRLAYFPIAEPSLTHTPLPFAGDCARGLLTFQVPAGQRAVFVEHVTSRPPIRWNVP